MSRRMTEPMNAVQRDAVMRDTIMREKLAQYGLQKHIFTQTETEQEPWKPSMKIFPDRDCYDLPTYPRKPGGQANQGTWGGPQ